MLLCHSLGVTGGVVAAAMHADRDGDRDGDNNHGGAKEGQGGGYPLGGLIASGMGNTSSTQETIVDVFEPVGPNSEYIKFPVAAKNVVMLNIPGTVADEVLACSEKLDSAMPTIEALRFGEAWMGVWKERWACKVRVPVLVALAQDDPYFLGTEGEVEVCV